MPSARSRSTPDTRRGESGRSPPLGEGWRVEQCTFLVDYVATRPEFSAVPVPSRLLRTSLWRCRRRPPAHRTRPGNPAGRGVRPLPLFRPVFVAAVPLGSAAIRHDRPRSPALFAVRACFAFSSRTSPPYRATAALIHRAVHDERSPGVGRSKPASLLILKRVPPLDLVQRLWSTSMFIIT